MIGTIEGENTMALESLVGTRVDPFTPEDRIMHTEKVAERTFGVPASELGTVEMSGDRAVLIVEVDGKKRVLRWKRHTRGQIQWFVDDNETPLALSGGNNVLARLYRELGA